MLVRVSDELVADEVVLVVVAEADRLDHQQQHEERDRVVEDLDHQTRALQEVARERVRLVGVVGGDRGGERADRVAVAQLGGDERRIEREQLLAGHERVQREPVREVARRLDDQVPERLVDRVADVEVALGGEQLGARLQLGALRGVRARRGAPRGVGADARPHLQHRPLDAQLRRDVAGRRELEQQLQPAVPPPVPHPRRPALGDPHEPGLLQALERLADGVAAGAEVLGEPALRRQRVLVAGQDPRPQVLVDAPPRTGCTSHRATGCTRIAASRALQRVSRVELPTRQRHASVTRAATRPCSLGACRTSHAERSPRCSRSYSPPRWPDP